MNAANKKEKELLSHGLNIYQLLIDSTRTILNVSINKEPSRVFTLVLWLN